MNRTYMKTGLFAVLVMALIMSPACAQVSIEGSTTVQPIAEQCASDYTSCGGGLVTVANPGCGSSCGIQSVANGSVDIGMASRDLKPAEQSLGLVTHAIAKDSVAVVVHPSNPISSLTKDQLKNIFCDCTTTDVVYARADGSGTRDCFEQAIGCSATCGTIVTSNVAMRTAVAGDVNAIGYLSLGYVDSSVKVVSLADVTISRTLYMLTKGAPDADEQAYLNYVFSGCGQKVVVSNGFIPAQTGNIDGDGVCAGGVCASSITMDDVIYLAKYYYGTDLFPDYGTIYADGDINCDDGINMDDAIYLAKHYYGTDLFPDHGTLYPC